MWTLQQEHYKKKEKEAIDIIIALATIIVIAIAKKVMKKKLPKLESFWHIIVKNGHFGA